ncbi:hypothetical protein SAMN05660845_1534 [Flavobacterium swingsii]|jgi:hypothetical protein|uniref:Uncharacterized protein n=1 Tax=Flavobacterium swingsii TaxID=498292 RepID=A0A1I0Y8L5_9FLAO|nr:DUF6327 family protein [Flavobacterium swingsii]SFB08830.1 hypothetical protein SAMN05660845_1534 [Flavobacterium swingsii]
MGTKKYASYAEIERELEILKLEKEINYQKLVLSVQKTKESFTPQNIVSGFLGSYKEIISDSYVTMGKMAIPYIINWLLNRKRGD